MFAPGALGVRAVHVGPRVQILPAFQVQRHLERHEAATQTEACARCLGIGLFQLEALVALIAFVSAGGHLGRLEATQVVRQHCFATLGAVITNHGHGGPPSPRMIGQDVGNIIRGQGQGTGYRVILSL
jgi:hypothetical protein